MLFDDWLDDHFNDWKPMFDSKVMEENQDMPLSFRKTLLSILNLPVTLECPESEIIR